MIDRPLKILVACERSGTVRDAFLRLGHYAISCDLEPTDRPGPHYHGNVLDILGDSWDMLIAHPECTYLGVTANKWLKDQPPRKSGALVGAERREAQKHAISFFMKFEDEARHIPKRCIENTVGIMSTVWRKPDQIICPTMFGHKEPKKTCLWLHGLPKLVPTDIVEPEYHITASGKRVPKWFFYADKSGGQKGRAQIRAATFSGVANAFALQWGSDQQERLFEGKQLLLF